VIQRSRGIGDQRLHFLRRVAADQRAEHDMAAGIAGWQLAGAGRQLGEELISDRLVDDDPLRRHADLTLVHECAEDGGIDRAVDIGVAASRGEEVVRLRKTIRTAHNCVTGAPIPEQRARLLSMPYGSGC